MSDSVRVGNGHLTEASCVEDDPGNVYDKCGELKIQNAIFWNVVVLPKSKLNLISLPVFMEEGWILGGNDKSCSWQKEHIV